MLNVVGCGVVVLVEWRSLGRVGSEVCCGVVVSWYLVLWWCLVAW
jgi:hypothetical protein